MQTMLPIQIPPLQAPITYADTILLTGSCFTEHISDRLAQHKFRVMANPHGILFNPLSVASALDSYLEHKQYTEADLFYLNELWNSWDHHTRFSNIDSGVALEGINRHQREAAAFIGTAGWVIITLGSAFQYYLKETGKPVANNHRAPSQWFEKRLLTTEEIINALHTLLLKLYQVNPNVQVLFTISPVRHIRDGVVDNNRSKARLIEAVHTLCERFEPCGYFPAYEMLIDVLRDYRYYDIDLVHPNYAGTTAVFERFVASCIDADTQKLMEQVNEIATAARHRPRFPETQAHQKFKSAYAAKTRELMGQYPFLDMAAELAYFENAG